MSTTSPPRSASMRPDEWQPGGFATKHGFSSASDLPMAPRTMPTKGHKTRPSITNPMGWLSRSTTSNSISPGRHRGEDKSERSIEHGSERGRLGGGAIIVGTPEEALQKTHVRLQSEQLSQQSEPLSELGKQLALRRKYSSRNERGHETSISPRKAQTPLPPLPYEEGEDADLYVEEEAAEEEDDQDHTMRSRPPMPVRPVPSPALPPTPFTPSESPVPGPSSPRPLLKPAPAPLLVTSESVTPPLPSAVPLPEAPIFKPVLVSELSGSPITTDLGRVIVTLETCTKTYRTTAQTLMSRPSNLATYVESLLPKRERMDSASVYSDDMSTYRNHLTSMGLVREVASHVHIFLDRPSSPYEHVLAYLRTPEAEPGGPPETLPRGVLSQPSPRAELDALLDLRDEALYLDLEPLYKLCVDEIRHMHRQQPTRTHQRGGSNASATMIGSHQSLHASVHSLPALAEKSGLERMGLGFTTVRDERTLDAGVRSPPPPSEGSRYPASPRSSTGHRSRSSNGPPPRSSSKPPTIRTPPPPAGWI
ncbi:hypothetical protein EV715DRAFT_193073 [Schizophyllum commune]